MAAISPSAVVFGVPAPRPALSVLGQPLVDQIRGLPGTSTDLAMGHLPFDLGNPLVCVVVLWSAIAVSVALWWMVRGLTLWLKKPRSPKPQAVPTLTTDDLMEHARETFKKRIVWIDQSDLPADAKKHARNEAERQYMREVKEVLRCQ